MGVVPPPIQQQPKKTNVTLIVLIVVAVGICFVLPVGAALVFPLIAHNRTNARKEATMEDARMIVQAVLLYATDHDETLPAAYSTAGDLHAAVAPYATGPLKFESGNPLGGEFLPNNYVEGAPLDRIFLPHRAVLIYDSKTWESGNGHIVGYASGQAAYVPDFDGLHLPVAVYAPDEGE